MSEKTPAGQMPATDSADEMRDLVGDDSTATFESDPKFIEPTPGQQGSSENLQDRKDREEIQHDPSLKTRDTDDVKDSDEEITEADDLSAQNEEDDENMEDDDADMNAGRRMRKALPSCVPRRRPKKKIQRTTKTTTMSSTTMTMNSKTMTKRTTMKMTPSTKTMTNSKTTMMRKMTTPMK